MEFISIDGLRADGRRPLELRNVKSEIGTYTQVDGSAVLEMGMSKVLATVTGPSADPGRFGSDLPSVSCTCLVAPFCGGLRRVRGVRDRRNMELAHAIETTVQQSLVPNTLARSRIDIAVNLLEADGGVDACAINAVMLALADAGIPMKDLAVACTAGILEGHHVLDMNHFEESSSCPRLLIAWQPSLDRLLHIQMFSRGSVDVFEAMLEAGQAGCERIHGELQAALNERLKQLAIGTAGHEN